MVGKRKRSPSIIGPQPLASEHRIIVGVDYGTTYTGVSYINSMAADLRDIILVDTWPGPSRNSESVIKSPSRISYPTENPEISERCWGYQIKPGMTSSSWTKLFLDQNTPLGSYDDPALERAAENGILRLPPGLSAVDVVADYLSMVYNYILERIAKHITKDTLRVTPIEFWFTVPAIWSDQAQNATLTAARRAGFGESISRPDDKIFLVSEPEAAAITVLKKHTGAGVQGFVKPGDGVLVCDCGGGTVDITTYLVVRTTPTLSFEELCTGAGGKCGSTAIDRKFYELMSSRFGRAFDTLPIKRKGPGSELMKAFEIVKRDFGHPTGNTTFELPLNMTVQGISPQYFDADERLVIISSADLRSIFDPVVEQILGLVRKQINDAREETGKKIVNRIFLVGGFGDSEYLRQAFRSCFECQGIAVTIPDRPQAAIVQGAALRGLEGLQSRTRRCRRHYGFTRDIGFRDGIAQESESYISEWHGTKMVKDIFKWVGAKYAENYTYSYSLSRTHYVSGSLSYSSTLYACDLAAAPERKGSDVYMVGNIDVDFSNIDLKGFKSKYINGRLAYRLKYDIKVIFGAKDGVLKFEAWSTGQKIGETSISFNSVKYY